MAEFATIARPYAKALFDLASEQNQLESWLGELKTLAEVVSQPRVAAFIDEPETGYEAKADGVLSLLERQPADATLKNFVYTLAENKRLSVLPEIYAQYQDLSLSRNNTKKATIYSAYSMTEGQLGKLITDLQSRFDSKLEAELVVQPDLIGGVKVEIGDQVLDLSVQGRLNSLYAAMMN
ncbi:F-type H+-transporting ATPase subunit delta [Neisseria sp. HSC-16F19]|nr:F0F1 ATP synthase subunit delta [Neisseria sp. HSC-16F19]MCP2039552.1 F-type H+-transporting ATPase subunit delta [Neisseria sp. HSC-16F19]